MYKKGLDPEGLLTSGGGTESQRLEPTAQAATWKEYVCENEFQAIYNHIVSYSITSILSKVVHSNTLLLTISFAYPCRTLGVW